MRDTSSLTYKALNNFDFTLDFFDPLIRSFEMPAVVGYSNARALAKIGNIMLNDGKPILSNPSIIKEASTVAVSGLDNFLQLISGFTKGGFATYSKYQTAYTHFGAGGGVLLVDPAYKLAFSYTMNKMSSGLDDPRREALMDGVYEILSKVQH